MSCLDIRTVDCMDHRVQAWEGARHKRHIASKDVPWVSLSHPVRSCNSGVCWTLVPDDSSKESRGKGAWKPDYPSGLALNHPQPFDADHRVQLGRYDVDGPDIRNAHPGGKHEQDRRGRCNAREERRGGQAEGTVASTQPVRKGMRVTKAKDGRRGNPTQGTDEPSRSTRSRTTMPLSPTRLVRCGPRKRTSTECKHPAPGIATPTRRKLHAWTVWQMDADSHDLCLAMPTPDLFQSSFRPCCF